MSLTVSARSISGICQDFERFLSALSTDWEPSRARLSLMKEQTAPFGDDRPVSARIAHLTPRDVLRIDPEPLARLQAALGPQGAEDVVCRALEDISHRLRRLSEDHAHHDVDRMARMARGARSIGAVAAQIGLRDLALVAGHVLDCAGRNDPAALAATLARMFRVGRWAINEIGQVRFSGY